MDVDIAVLLLYLAVFVFSLRMCARILGVADITLKRCVIIALAIGIPANDLTWSGYDGMEALGIQRHIWYYAWRFFVWGALCWLVMAAWPICAKIYRIATKPVWDKRRRRNEGEEADDSWSDLARRYGVPYLKCGGLFTLVFVMSVYFVDALFLGSAYVPTESMRPALEVGDHVLVIRRPSGHHLSRIFDTVWGPGTVRRGDVLEFERVLGDDGGRRISMLKRCIAVGGDVIQVSGGDVKLDSKDLNEPYKRDQVNFRSVPTKFGESPLKVPTDEYFLLGDNRGNSQDSRFFGPMPYRSLCGKVLAVYWPPWHARWL